MPESPDGQTIRFWTDPEIIDAAGNAWRVTRLGRITVDGLSDGPLDGVTELTYRGRVFYAYIGTMARWFTKAHPRDRWVTSNGPPIPNDTQRVLIAIERLWENINGKFAGEGAETNVIAQALVTIQDAISGILAILAKPPADTVAHSVRPGMPYYLVKGQKFPMAINIIDDATSVIPLEFDNLANQPVPPPAGGTATLTLTNGANFWAQMAPDGSPNIHITPVQPATEGATTDLTYADTLPGGVVLSMTITGLVITADQAAVSVHARTDAITTIALETPPVAPVAPPNA